MRIYIPMYMVVEACGYECVTTVPTVHKHYVYVVSLQLGGKQVMQFYIITGHSTSLEPDVIEAHCYGADKGSD